MVISDKHTGLLCQCKFYWCEKFNRTGPCISFSLSAPPPLFCLEDFVSSFESFCSTHLGCQNEYSTHSSLYIHNSFNRHLVPDDHQISQRETLRPAVCVRSSERRTFELSLCLHRVHGICDHRKRNGWTIFSCGFLVCDCDSTIPSSCGRHVPALNPSGTILQHFLH
jgi:hypothetical protein